MVSANTTVNRTLGISFVIEVLMCAGNHNKFQFTRPAAAQRAASLLGTTPEELARCIFTQGGTSTLSRSTSLRWVDLHVCVYIQDYFIISWEKLKRGWTLTTSQYTITHIVYFKIQRTVIENTTTTTKFYRHAQLMRYIIKICLLKHYIGCGCLYYRFQTCCAKLICVCLSICLCLTVPGGMDIKCWQWFACVWQSTRGHGEGWLPDSGRQHLSHWSSGGFRYWTLRRCLQCRCVADQQVPQKITLSICETLKDFVKGLCTDTSNAAVSLINRSGLCYRTFLWDLPCCSVADQQTSQKITFSVSETLQKDFINVIGLLWCHHCFCVSDHQVSLIWCWHSLGFFIVELACGEAFSGVSDQNIGCHYGQCVQKPIFHDYLWRLQYFPFHCWAGRRLIYGCYFGNGLLGIPAAKWAVSIKSCFVTHSQKMTKTHAPAF